MRMWRAWRPASLVFLALATQLIAPPIGGFSVAFAQGSVDPLSVYTLCVTAAYLELLPRYGDPAAAYVKAESACEIPRAQLATDVRRTAGAGTDQVLLGIDVVLLKSLRAELPGGGASATPPPPDRTAPQLSFTPNIPLQSCGFESGARSRDGAQMVRLEFVNTSGEQRYLFWLDYDGKRVLYAAVGPGQSHTQDTYATHPWVVTDAAGRCRGLVVAAATGRVNMY